VIKWSQLEGALEVLAGRVGDDLDAFDLEGDTHIDWFDLSFDIAYLSVLLDCTKGSPFFDDCLQNVSIGHSSVFKHS
jgi:hypothetical protein